MSNRLVVTGTDTGIGKTIFSAALARALRASYWKPVQAGLEGETDSQTVARLSGQPVLPEAYRLTLPASPHLAAKAEGRRIEPARLALPAVSGPLVVEGAGGVMVPLNRELLFLDVFVRWDAPVILCARTVLGTINHSLLSLAALRDRGCTVLGIVFLGDANPEVEATISDFGQCHNLGRLPFLPALNATTLARAFAEGFDRSAFLPMNGSPP